jgi:NAD-dependent SIR2 family protein deacetylase
LIHTDLSPELLRSLATLIGGADYLLIGAGAGLSADAGYDYGESEQFLKRYPYLKSVGVHCRYHSIGFRWPSKSMEWAFYARHLEEDLYSPPPNPSPYLQLAELTRRADRWVFTSNADDLFPRLGFSAERLWTVQGTFHNLQCLRPCCDQVWESKPYIDRLLPSINLKTGDVADPSVVPHCPRCGGDMMLNVRGGRWFVEKPYDSQRAAFEKWLSEAARGRLIVLDIGSGFNTPSVIRWPCEVIVAKHSNAHLIRINLHHPKTQLPVDGRATCISMRASEVTAALHAHSAPLDGARAR